MGKKFAISSISAKTNVHDIVSAFPEAIDFLARKGFRDLRNPVMRNTLARFATLEMACAMHNKNPEALIRGLKKFLQKKKKQ